MSETTRKKGGPLKSQPPRRGTVQVPCGPNDSADDAVARQLSRPSVQAAATIQSFQGDVLEVNALAQELSDQISKVNGGDLRRAEGMLVAQAHTLDNLFNYLARRGHQNIGEYLGAAETYLRLALKAQSQCRATLETLATIKNPPIVYARQANVTTGPQQVNNGIPSPCAREIESEQSKLLEARNGERLDPRKASAASGAYSSLEAMGNVNRP